MEDIFHCQQECLIFFQCSLELNFVSTFLFLFQQIPVLEKDIWAKIQITKPYITDNLTAIAKFSLFESKFAYGKIKLSEIPREIISKVFLRKCNFHESRFFVKESVITMWPSHRSLLDFILFKKACHLHFLWITLSHFIQTLGGGHVSGPYNKRDIAVFRTYYASWSDRS